MRYKHGGPNGSMTTTPDEPVQRSNTTMMTSYGCDDVNNDNAELVCAHLLEVTEPDYHRWYTGDGPQYALTLQHVRRRRCAARRRAAQRLPGLLRARGSGWILGWQRRRTSHP